MKPKKSNSLSFGIVFWIAAILLILVIFFINKPEIARVLEKTKFFEVVQQQNDTIDVEIRTPDPPHKPDSPDISEQVPESSIPPEVAEQPDAAVPETVPEQSTETVDRTTEKPPASEKETAGSVRVQLYYLHADDDGNIALQASFRQIPQTTAPLTATIQELLTGPTKEEQTKGLVSLIPPGSKLLSAQVRNNIAYLNFNEAFRFNPNGKEGGTIQLMQIVFSAIEFTTVTSVQFLIEGKIFEYLNGDGVFIGQPLKKQHLRFVSHL